MQNKLGHIFPFVTLLILDGWGESKDVHYNPIKIANTPTLNYLYKNSYSTLLGASGLDVGLPKGTIGNSEVGHSNIGAGKVILQDILRINEDIENKSFFKNTTLLNTFYSAVEQNTSVHLVGLISDALVHSSLDHLFALIQMAKDTGVKELFIHAITDGRDTPIDSSYKYISEIIEFTKKVKLGTIATVGGRYYAMDRDSNWDRIEKYYNCIANEAFQCPTFDNPIDGIKESLGNKITDEFILPFRISFNGNIKLIKNNDSIVFFNFREDRARELTKCFVDDNFNYFPIKKAQTFFTTLTEYEKGLCKNVVYPKLITQNTLSQIISEHNFMQLKIAETEKYAHVTYFLNGGREEAFPLEDRILIPSLKIATYDLDPRMKVFEITDELVNRIKSKRYKLLVANFANADMVGHTGNMDATVKACEYIDECIEKVMRTTFENNGMLVITGDHGNAEEKYDENRKQILTKHTTNPVPLIISSKNTMGSIKMREGNLSDIAPTILPLIGLDKPATMSGINLMN